MSQTLVASPTRTSTPTNPAPTATYTPSAARQTRKSHIDQIRYAIADSIANRHTYTDAHADAHARARQPRHTRSRRAISHASTPRSAARRCSWTRTYHLSAARLWFAIPAPLPGPLFAAWVGRVRSAAHDRMGAVGHRGGCTGLDCARRHSADDHRPALCVYVGRTMLAVL